MPEYETIYALDARGGRTEIPYFLDAGIYYGRDDEYIYEISLTPEWSYNVLCISREDYSPHEGYSGSFMETEWEEDHRAYTFRREHRMHMGDEGFEYDYKPVTGSCKVLVHDFSYDIELSGSDVLPSGLRIQNEDNLEESIYAD